MGMYNEIYKNCPRCGKRCEQQISQVVLGFGCFDLDNPQDLAGRLTSEELYDLHERAMKETFWCRFDENGCGHHFMLGSQDSDREALTSELFGNSARNVDCPDCKALLRINSDGSVTFLKHRT